MLSDTVIAAIRTGVAALVGMLITWLVSKGVDLPEDVGVNLTLVVTVLVIALYNLVVNYLERNVNPKLGVLLGIPKAPHYADDKAAPAEPYVDPDISPESGDGWDGNHPAL